MRIVLATVIFLISYSVADAATRVPGTKVSLDPPKGFEATTQFPGFVLPPERASIMVNEMPAPFSEFAKGATKEGLATRGVLVHERKATRISGHDGFLIRASQAINGVEYRKWMLVFGNEKNSVMVLGTYHATDNDTLGEVLKKAVLSSTWDLDANVDFFEGLTFRVKEKGGMKIAKKVGNTLLITRKGVFPQPDTLAPLVVVGSSITENWEVPGDRMDYARERLLLTEVLRDAKIIAETKVPLDGLDAYAMEAEATDTKVGKTLYVLHCLIYSPDGYYIFQGFVDQAHQDHYSPIFLDILRSFKRV